MTLTRLPHPWSREGYGVVLPAGSDISVLGALRDVVPAWHERLLSTPGADPLAEILGHPARAAAEVAMVLEVWVSDPTDRWVPSDVRLRWRVGDSAFGTGLSGPDPLVSTLPEWARGSALARALARVGGVDWEPGRALGVLRVQDMLEAREVLRSGDSVMPDAECLPWFEVDGDYLVMLRDGSCWRGGLAECAGAPWRQVGSIDVVLPAVLEGMWRSRDPGAEWVARVFGDLG